MIKYLQIILGLYLFSCVQHPPPSDISQSGDSGISIEFYEERRLNKEIDWPEVILVNSPEKLVELYAELEDPSFPRSAPIPSFDPTQETILILKPSLKSNNHSDIEILQIIENKKGDISISYQEIENEEFVRNNWNDPILIIRTPYKPKSVKLIKHNK